MTETRQSFRAKRLSLGLSYQDTARFLGVSERTIRNWEATPPRGSQEFAHGRYDAEVHPLLRLLPHASGLAFLPQELKARLLALHARLRHPAPNLLEVIHHIQKEALESWIATASHQKEHNHVH